MFSPPQSRGKGHLFETMFPALFCFISMCVFLCPLVSCIYIASDPHFAFWLGQWPLVCLAFPLIFIAVFIFHSRHGYLHRTAFIMSIVVPASFLCLLGVIILFQSSSLASKLTSSECSSTPQLLEVTNSWRSLRQFHACCLKSNGFAGESDDCNDPKVKLGETNWGHLPVQACPDYLQKMDEKNNGYYWPYFAFLETNYHCTGFCESGEPAVFGHEQDVLDGCANSVAAVVTSKGVHAGLQLLVYNLVLLMTFMMYNAFMGPTLRLLSKDAAMQIQ